MALHLTQHRGGFETGLTVITHLDEAVDDTGIGLGRPQARGGPGIQGNGGDGNRLAAHGRPGHRRGGGQDRGPGTDVSFRRKRQLPPRPRWHRGVAFRPTGPAEFTRYTVANDKSFSCRFFFPGDVPNEHRGAGQVGGTCLRFVRTIFDGASSEAEAQLVLGEVVTMPGRWSSYPPHHHPQPEIYHYRFTEPQGYGHAELGETVLKVRQYDTVKIFDGYDHAQCAAPGYGMYYSWVIRHLPDRPYTIPEFTEEHRWIMEDSARFWGPAEGDENA